MNNIKVFDFQSSSVRTVLIAGEPWFVAQEMVSLPSANVWLTPTDIAERLDIRYSTGRGNARTINKLLLDLGYQDVFVDHKGRKKYNPTDKAISSNLCDRKPIVTDSSTQQDQLLWSEGVVLILKERAVG